MRERSGGREGASRPGGGEEEEDADAEDRGDRKVGRAEGRTQPWQMSASELRGWSRRRAGAPRDVGGEDRVRRRSTTPRAQSGRAGSPSNLNQLKFVIKKIDRLKEHGGGGSRAPAGRCHSSSPRPTRPL